MSDVPLSASEEAAQAAELAKAAASYDKLLVACDGEPATTMTVFDASTYMAMLNDPEYKADVLACHAKLF